MAVQLNPNMKLRGLSATLKKEANETLWRRGDIVGFLLDTTQMGMYYEITKSTALVHVVLSSRRLGKSFLLSTLCVAKAMQKEHQLIKFITGTQRNARDIILPIFRQVLSSCPEDLKPEWRVHENRWKFPNGSEIALYGVDSTGGDDIRGQAADFYVVDEAGFIPKLDVLVKEILNPMIIERNGRGVLSSTPPRSQTHPFVPFIVKAEKEGTLTKRTIYDCPRFTEKMIRSFEDEAGGKDSDVFKREYECKMVFLSEDSVIPEFTEDLQKEIVYSGKQVLNYVPDRYVALDVGFSDATGILFAYYNFTEAILYIEKEYCETGNNTEEIASAVTKMERELWGGMPPTKRVSDTDLRLIKDLRDLHGLRFVPTQKDQKEAQINNLRILLAQKRIKIHESCKDLIMQLRYGQWKTTSTGRRDYARSAELGHLDLIDALLYLVRNVNFNRNPIPDPQVDPHSYWYTPESQRMSNMAKKLVKAFRR